VSTHSVQLGDEFGGDTCSRPQMRTIGVMPPVGSHVCVKHAVTATLEYFSELFAEHHVRWAVVGALAANAYRLRTRTTTDVDLLTVLS
jgi:hypothetical protein